MPRVSEDVLDVVVYVYPNETAARQSESLGGTGFLIGMRVTEITDTEVWHLYVVTNRHVVMNEPEPAVRINMIEPNQWSIITISHSDWLYHPDGDDVAIAPIGLEPQHRLKVVKETELLARDAFGTPLIGVGSDCHFVGRFQAVASEEAREAQNFPTLRFGTVATEVMPILQEPTGVRQESVLIEARSLSGYSGSPVFVWDAPAVTNRGIPLSGHGDRHLLGIDWGHLADKTFVRNPDKSFVDEGWFVPSNSGMVCVVPAWKISDVLYSEALVKQRKDDIAQYRASDAKPKTGPLESYAVTDTTGSTPK